MYLGVDSIRESRFVQPIATDRPPAVWPYLGSVLARGSVGPMKRSVSKKTTAIELSRFWAKNCI